MKTEDISIEVHGGTIKALSEQLPTAVIALNELIKNSYDAGATEVSIELNSREGWLTVSDDGCGMHKQQIKDFFRLGQSSKKYGEKFWVKREGAMFEQRCVQGAKGLGFLAALKFGDVTWYTATKEEAYKFSCRQDIFKSKDINKNKILLEPTSKNAEGTKIIIRLDNYHKEKLISLFGLHGNENRTDISKIYNIFRASKMRIDIKLDGQSIPPEYLNDLVYAGLDRQLFYVKYSSNDSRVELYNNQNHIDYFSLVAPPGCEVEAEIVILDLRHQPEEPIPVLFRRADNSIAPLVFFNHNLFDNKDLFNPEETRKIKSSKSLPQMIGYVDIISEVPELEFNADRSRLVQNQTSDRIVKFISDFNKEIQSHCVEYKEAHLTDSVMKIGPAAPTEMVAKEKVKRSLPTRYIDERKRKRKNGGKEKTLRPLLPYKISEDWSDIIEMAVCRDLIDQLNSLYSSGNGRRYKAVIATALRCVFELSAKALTKSDNFTNQKNEEIIKNFIKKIKTEKELLSGMTASLGGIITFKTVQNIPDGEYEEAYRCSNIGAHSADALLEMDHIRKIALRASLFAVLVDNYLRTLVAKTQS